MSAVTVARPVLLEHKQYMAIRGLGHRLRRDRLVEAAEAIEAIANGYEAGEHLAVVDRDTLLAYEVRSNGNGGGSGKRRKHGRPRR